MTVRIRSTLLALGLAASMALGACATEEDPVIEGSPPSPERTQEAEAPTVNVIANDYSFGGIPSTIPAGSKLNFRNNSTEEVHEVVPFRLPETETRSAAEIFQLPEEELVALLGEPATVMIAAPGGDVIVPVGDGTLAEPGRYVFACFIQTGVDPDEYMDALQNADTEGPVNIPGAGPPHFVNGMFAEATVE